jgi:hypothetical protein
MRYSIAPLTSLARYMLIAALAALAPINAQSVDRLKFGLLGSTLIPMGDLKDLKAPGKSFGMFGGGGVFLEMSLHQNFALRGNLEYTFFSESNSSSSSNSSSNNDGEGVANCLGATGELMLRHDNGFYFFGGVGYLMPKLNNRFLRNSPDLDGGMGISAGVGYYPPILRGLGFEAKYIKSMSVKLGDKDFAFDWLQLSFTYRFKGREN